MLNVAINGRFLSHYTSGVARVATEFTKALDRLLINGTIGGRFRLICPPGTMPDALGLQAIQVEQVGKSISGHTWEQLVLPFRVGSGTLLCLGNTAPVLSLVAGKRVGLMIHDMSYREFSNAYRWRYRAGHRMLSPVLLRFSRPVFTVSNSEKQSILRVDPSIEGRIVVAQNGGWGSTPGISAVRRSRAPGSGYVLYVGSLSERKNIRGLEAVAIRIAREFGIGTKLIGGSANIFRYSKPDLPSDVADLIEYCGHVENFDELAAAYEGARLLLFPSFYEASPLPPIEAMHFGCPVVAADIPSIRERCGDAVQYCNPYSVESIFQSASKVLTDSGRADELMNAGYRQETIYSWERQALTIIRALDELR